MSTSSTAPLSPDDIHRYRVAFDAFAKSKTGSLSIRELAAMMDAIHFHYTPMTLKRAMQAMDLDHSNSIEWEEWLAYLQEHKPIVPENFAEVALRLANDPNEAEEHERRVKEAEAKLEAWRKKEAAALLSRQSSSESLGSAISHHSAHSTDLSRALIPEVEPEEDQPENHAKPIMFQHGNRTVKAIQEAQERASVLKFDFSWGSS